MQERAQQIHDKRQTKRSELLEEYKTLSSFTAKRQKNKSLNAKAIAKADEILGQFVPPEAPDCCICMLQDCMNNNLRNPSFTNQFTTIDKRRFLNSMTESYIYDEFEFGVQHDAGEFLKHLLTQFDTILQYQTPSVNLIWYVDKLPSK
jgi:hypothetical protein